MQPIFDWHDKDKLKIFNVQMDFIVVVVLNIHYFLFDACNMFQKSKD